MYTLKVNDYLDYKQSIQNMTIKKLNVSYKTELIHEQLFCTFNFSLLLDSRNFLLPVNKYLKTCYQLCIHEFIQIILS